MTCRSEVQIRVGNIVNVTIPSIGVFLSVFIFIIHLEFFTHSSPLHKVSCKKVVHKRTFDVRCYE